MHHSGRFLTDILKYGRLFKLKALKPGSAQIKPLVSMFPRSWLFPAIVYLIPFLFFGLESLSTRLTKCRPPF